MSVINEFKIIGYCNQDTLIKNTKNDKKIAYNVIRPINSEKTLIPVISFGDDAVRLKYLGSKDNLLILSGSITSSISIISGNKTLVASLVVNDIDVVNFKPLTISERNFTDLFKLYDLPKYIPSIKGEK